MKIDIFTNPKVEEAESCEGMKGIHDIHKETTRYCMNFLNYLLVKEKYITKSAIKRTCHLGQDALTLILTNPEDRILSSATKERLALGIMLLMPDLNRIYANKRLTDKRHLPFKPIVCIDNLKTLDYLRHEYLKAFGSFGYALMEKDFEDDTYLKDCLEAYLVFFKKKK